MTGTYFRLALLVGGDVVLLGASFANTLLAAHEAHARTTLSMRMLWLVTLAVVWFISASASLAYETTIVSRSGNSAYIAIRAAIVTLVVFLAIPYLGGPLPQSRAVLAAFITSVIVSLAIWRTAYALVTPFALRTRPAVIVGAGRAGRTILETMQRFAHSGLVPIGFLDDDQSKLGTFVAGLPVLGDSSWLDDQEWTGSSPEIVVAVTRDMRPELFAALSRAYTAGATVTPMPELYELLCGRVAVEHTDGLWYVLPRTASQNPFYHIVKRGIDIVGAALGLALFVSMFPFLAALVRASSPGPIFHQQRRVGRHGRAFTLYKLRTMPVDPQRLSLPMWQRKHTQSSTPIGSFLRCTRLDEFPQFWNVLVGNMSLVGPRPYLVDEVAELQERLPFFRVRSLVKPGITGWAQARWGYGKSYEDELEKLQLDMYYVKHQSVYLDLLISAHTAIHVFTSVMGDAMAKLRRTASRSSTKLGPSPPVPGV